VRSVVERRASYLAEDDLQRIAAAYHRRARAADRLAAGERAHGDRVLANLLPNRVHLRTLRYQIPAGCRSACGAAHPRAAACRGACGAALLRVIGVGSDRALAGARVPLRCWD